MARDEDAGRLLAAEGAKLIFVATPEQKKANLRLGLILASVAVIFFVGFIVRMAYFGA